MSAIPFKLFNFQQNLKICAVYSTSCRLQLLKENKSLKQGHEQQRPMWVQSLQVSAFIR